MTTQYAELEGRVAGFVSRAVAFSTDLAIVVLIAGVLTFVLTNLESLLERFLPNREFNLDAVLVVLIPLVIAIYYIGSWALTGATVGKWLLGLRVVRADGTPPTVVRSIIRFVGYGISAIVFFLGYLWVLVDDERRAWHDDMAGTWVVYDFQRRHEGEVYSQRLDH
jgi:uncharacterized RDD family membrane protein YckC